ncbi:isopentenyl phosphate kinase [Halovivax gelatinilyticus]|uniref:isopentenyl phosphate kinase n=1 Tax=Halovivax gelatinilyticus TaxID=2961597 RepID=UPI0020CA35E9|nr:isopentenyl phosphate kinase [Halovivax gelatinilyticus]
MTVVVKLGGSVITRKSEPETVDEAALDRASDAIAEALDSSAVGRLIVVHGGGSFGHHHANEFGVSTTEGRHDVEAVAAIHGAMCALNESVVRWLRARGVPAVPVHPFSLAHRDRTGALSLPSGSVSTLLCEGFVPVVHGDLVAHESAGVTVLSGDELVVELADAVGAERVGLCSSVPGVLDESDAVIERIDSFEAVANVVGGSDATDVSGGMAGKVRTLLDLERPATIFDLDGLESFLRGESVGTTVD